MNSWQLIETAPKDGTRIIGRRFRCVDRYTGVMRYVTHRTYWGRKAPTNGHGTDYNIGG